MASLSFKKFCLWVTFATLALSYLPTYAASLLQSSNPEISWLGFYVEDSVEGVQIVYSENNTPATQVSLSRGSIILKVNEVDIHTEVDYYTQLLMVPPNTELNVTIRNVQENIVQIYSFRTIPIPLEIALYRQGVVLVSLGQSDRAYGRLGLDLLTKAEQLVDIAISNLSDEEPLIGLHLPYQRLRIWERIGDTYTSLGNPTMALVYYQKAIELSDLRYFSHEELHPDLIIDARIWYKIGNIYADQLDTNNAWMSYDKAQKALSSYAHYHEAITLILDAQEKLGNSIIVQPTIALGYNYYKLGQFLVAASSFEGAAEIAKRNDELAYAVDAYIGLAAVYYAIGDLNQFYEIVDQMLTLSGSERSTTWRKIISEVALYEIGVVLKEAAALYQEGNVDTFVNHWLLPRELANIIIYRYIVVDIDNDGEDETIIAGGTTHDGGTGVSLLFDWQAGVLEHYFLGEPIDGFKNLTIKDFNQDGRKEIMILYQHGSGAYLFPYIYQYDGQMIRSLFDWQRTDLIVPFYQGYADFKDMNADGIDELIIWRSSQDGECNWCDQHYMIFVLEWNGHEYIWQEMYETELTYFPQIVLDQNVSPFGISTAPVDLALMIQASKDELEHHKAQKSVPTKFVDELLGRSQSLWVQRLELFLNNVWRR